MSDITDVLRVLVCIQCLRAKSWDDYYEQYIRPQCKTPRCKRCVLYKQKLYRQKNKERIKKYDRDRSRRPKRKADRRETIRRYRKRHPEKYRAHVALNNAVRDGCIKKLPCEECGEPKSQGHHHDYSKPLDVRWLCDPCHKREHNG